MVEGPAFHRDYQSRSPRVVCGIGLLSPLLQPVERHAELAREEFDGATAQQAEHYFALASHAPSLTRRQCTLGPCHHGL
jgi:hypothetical protein